MENSLSTKCLINKGNKLNMSHNFEPFDVAMKVKVISHFHENATIKITLEIIDDHQSAIQEKNVYPIKTQNLIHKLEKILIDFYEKKESKMLILDHDNLQLKYGSQNIKLTCLEFSLMVLFNKTPKRIFTREKIIELAYHQTPDITDRAIDCHIKNLRKKIRSLGLDGTVIESVYGLGYRYFLAS